MNVLPGLAPVSRLPVALLLAFLTATLASAQKIDARFSTEKSEYLAGEPVFVTLTLYNKTGQTIWLDFKPPGLPFLCQDFDVDILGAQRVDNGWGCGIAGSCGRGLKEVHSGGKLTERELLNRRYSLRPGDYALHARTTLVLRSQNLWHAPEIGQEEISDDLSISVQQSTEDQLKAAFEPFLKDLHSEDPTERAEAAEAILELAPRFLEDTLIGLTETSKFSTSGIDALRKANTPKTRAELAKIATGSGEIVLRVRAIQALGRTGDATYLTTFSQLLGSDNEQIRDAAAGAAGTLGGATAVPRLATLAMNPDPHTRVAAASALGMTRARESVPILIHLILDPDSTVRESTVSALFLLTHRVAFQGSKWADISTLQSASDVHQRWVKWWESHAATARMHGMADCSPPQPLD
jgi:HEAT repeats